MKHIAPRVDHVWQRQGSRGRFWRQVLKRFAGGGQSIRGFCESHGLSQPSFYSWRRRLADADAAWASPRTSRPAFVPVHVAAQSGGSMEIVLRGDRRIRLCGPVDPAALAQVVAALESLPRRSPCGEGGGRC